MLIVHLLVCFIRVSFCHFSLPLGVGSWRRIVTVALPGLFYKLFLLFNFTKLKGISRIWGISDIIIVNKNDFENKNMSLRQISSEKEILWEPGNHTGCKYTRQRF